MSNRVETFYLGTIERRDKERAKQREKQRNIKTEKLRKSDYVSDEFFKTVRDGSGTIQSDDVPLETIVEEIVKIYKDGFMGETTEQQRKDRTLEIFSYMSEYGIIDNSLDYLEDKRLGGIVTKATGKDIKTRIIKMYDIIPKSKGAETLTLDAFYSNQITKIIDQILKRYRNGSHDVLFSRLYSDFKDKMMNENELFNLSDKQLQELENWFNNSENSKLAAKTNFKDFMSYVKLRTIKNEIYKEKYVDIITLCKEYPGQVKDYSTEEDKEKGRKLVYINLENYGLPIGLHIPEKIIEATLPNMEISKPTPRESIRRIQTLPIAFKENEIGKFKHLLEEFYIEEEKKLGLEFKDEVKEEEKQSEQLKENKQGRRKKYKEQYKTDVETLEMVCSSLSKANLVEVMPEEYKEKIMSRSKFNNTKLEKVYIDIENIVKQKGVKEDDVELETIKLFFYTKVMGRGFWNTNAEKRDMSFEKAFDEMQQHGEVFFKLINEGENLQDVVNKINELTGRKKTIVGARTIKTKPEVEEEKQEIVEDKPEERKQEEAPNIEDVKVPIGKKFEEPIIEEETKLDEEIRLNREEYNRLKEREQVLKASKQKLEKELNEIINGMEPLQIRRARIKSVLASEHMGFFGELHMEAKIQEAAAKLEDVENQLREYKKKREETKGKISNTDKEINEVEEKKKEIHKTIDNMFKDL